jgi:hypothetical protein
MEVCQGKLPRIKNVRGFDGILIHCGVDHSNSSGCILVGMNTIKGKLTNSKETFKKIYALMKEAHDNGETIYITILDITQQSWLHAFYISLAHNFGFHTNGIPFETLAILTPLSCLQKHRNSLFQLTAILLGQSGLLNELSITTSEEEELWTEYQFLKKKFQLSPMNANMWKKARMRPQNAPTTRIRQFAYLLQQSEFLFANLMNASDIKEMVDILRIKPLANTQRISQPAPMGLKSIEILLINTIIPYRYTYSLVHNPSMDINDAYKNLELIPAEDNTIIRQWKSLGQSVKSAADTQALLHLFQNYCQPHLCYNCQVGYKIFSQKQLANL